VELVDVSNFQRFGHDSFQCACTAMQYQLTPGKESVRLYTVRNSIAYNRRNERFVATTHVELQ